MNIKKLTIESLYGFLDKEISFNEKINLLVGINGSGKTSVLNVINWLLTPSWRELTTNKFKNLILEFNLDEEEYLLVCKQHDEEVTIDIKNVTTEEKMNTIQADLKAPIDVLQNNKNLKREIRNEFPRLKPEEDEVEAWKFLSNLPTPIIIGLDRNLYTEEGGDFSYSHESNFLANRNLSNASSPLLKVKKLSTSNYTKYRNQLLELNKKLNDTIMLSSFDVSLTEKGLKDIVNNPKLNLTEVEELERQVKNYFEEYILGRSNQTQQFLDNALKKIENYFQNLKKVLRKPERSVDDLIYVSYVNQFKKIDELIKEFENFEKHSDRYYEPVEEYLASINDFLEDSSKEIYFDKSSSNLKYRIFNEEKKEIVSNQEIESLSSGEKQILILFTYIKFNDELGKVFIIDEPELSLHPKWQESFLENIKKIMPENTQLIFATHSPTIVGGNKEYCKTLLPY